MKPHLVERFFRSLVTALAKAPPAQSLEPSHQDNIECCDREQGIETHRLWHKPRDNGWLGTGVADQGVVYVCDMGGVLHCIAVQSGEVLWKNRVEGGGTWSSITQTADGVMHLLSKTGSTTVFRPNQEKYDEIAVNALDETSNASVVVAGGEVYVRTDAALWCFAL